MTINKVFQKIKGHFENHHKGLSENELFRSLLLKDGVSKKDTLSSINTLFELGLIEYTSRDLIVPTKQAFITSLEELKKNISL